MTKENTIPTWGYSKDGDKIFELKAGESLPEGYFAHPAMIRGSDAEIKMRADAEKEGAKFQFEQPDPKEPEPKPEQRKK